MMGGDSSWSVDKLKPSYWLSMTHQHTLTVPGEVETGHHSPDIVSVQTALPQVIQPDSVMKENGQSF